MDLPVVGIEHCPTEEFVQPQRQCTVWSSTCQRNCTRGDASPHPVQLMRGTFLHRARSRAPLHPSTAAWAQPWESRRVGGSRRELEILRCGLGRLREQRLQSLQVRDPSVIHVLTVREGQQHVCDLDTDTRSMAPPSCSTYTGSGTTDGPGAEEHVERLELGAVEDPQTLEMRSISSRKPSRSNRLLGSSSVSSANMITKYAATPLRFRRRMRPIRWIICRRVRPRSSRRRGWRPAHRCPRPAQGRGNGVERADPEIVEDLRAVCPRGRTRDQFHRDEPDRAG